MEVLTKVKSNITKPNATFLLDYPSVKSYSSGMDSLRGILAIWVMVAHLSIWGGVANQQIWDWLLWFMKGLNLIFQPIGETHPAVVGFIVLSGYCIHRNGARRDGFNIWKYGMRRAFRIVPTYLLASAVGVAVFVYFTNIDLHTSQSITGTSRIRWDGLLVKLLGISAFIPNLHYFGFQGNAPLTTVMVEIWLYVFYAITMRWLISGVHEETLWKVIFVIWAIGLVIVGVYTKYYSWWNNGSFIAFLPYWWLGAVAVNKSNFRLLPNWKVMVLIYLLLTLGMISGVMHGTAQFLLGEFRKIILAVLFAYGIAYIDDARGYVIDWSAKLGKSSYSIYAYHAPILVMALILGLPWWLAPCLVLIVAVILNLVFEAPLTVMGKKLSLRIN